jgi:DNA-binding transcriptional ArsR family regulator
MANELASLDRTFAACAHPIRRQIIERLAGREMTVGQATGDYGVSKPAVSRHLRVLEEAGAIVRVVDGRTHRLRLSSDALADAQAWMEHQRALWERKFDVVEQVLSERGASR